jgi:hypothetical protein
MTRLIVRPHLTTLGSDPNAIQLVGGAPQDDQMAAILLACSTRGCFADDMGNCRTVAT